MSQNIINPDRRDPSRIRNKADIGLSRVDNVSVSDILDITKDLVRDEVYSGDRYAERELDMGVLFEIPLCMFTDNSTKLSITVSFLKGNEVLSNITAHISHSYDTDYRDPFEIEFDSLDNLVLNSGNIVSFYFYEKDNKQSVLSLRGDGNRLKVYGITAISYYFSDYIVISNDKEEHFSFRKLTNEKILVGDEVGKYYQSSVRKVYEYEPCRGDRSKTSTAKSLSVYDSSGNLIYDDTLNLASSQVDNYSFPTINEVPFTGSSNINILTDGEKDSTRNITIYAQHSGSTSEQAGEHDWEVLSTLRVLNAESATTEVVKSSEEYKEYGLCRGSKNTLNLSNITTPLGKVDKILTDLKDLDSNTVVSVSTFKGYLEGICSVLKNLLQTTGDFNIQFFGDEDETQSYSYIAISPYIGKGVKVWFNLKSPSRLGIKAKFFGENIVDLVKLVLTNENGSIVEKEIKKSEDDNYYSIYDPTQQTTTPPPPETTIQSQTHNIFKGYVIFKTIGNPFIIINSTESNFPEFSIYSVNSNTTNGNSDEKEEFRTQLRLKSPKSTSSAFAITIDGNTKLNPIVFTKACIYSKHENERGDYLTSIKSIDLSNKNDYCTNNYFQCGSSLNNSSGLLWKNKQEYGIILPPSSKTEFIENDNIFNNSILIEGYSISRYLKINVVYPDGQSPENYFETDEHGKVKFNILIRNSSNSQGFRLVTLINDDSNPIDLFDESKEILENHDYDDLTKESIINNQVGYGDEYDIYKFYLLFYPKGSDNSKFDQNNPQNNPTIKIIPCDSSGINCSEDLTVTIHTTQLKMPLYIESINSSSDSETYGVYSKLRLLYSEGYKGQSNVDEKALKISEEEFRLPITLNSSFNSDNGNLIIDNNFSIVSLEPRDKSDGDKGNYFRRDDEGKELSLVRKYIDNNKYETYINLKYNGIDYKVMDNETWDGAEQNYLKTLKISGLKNYLNTKYNKKYIWFSEKHYPDELLPQTQIDDCTYELNIPSDYTVSKYERRNNVVFALKRVAFTNYCPITPLDGIRCPSKHIHYNANPSAVFGNNVDENIPENKFGEGREYTIYCNNRTWGDTSSSNNKDEDLIRRLGNYLVRFGFEYDLSANFRNKELKIDATLVVVGPDKISAEPGSDIHRFANLSKDLGHNIPPLYNKLSSTDGTLLYNSDVANIGIYAEKYNSDPKFRKWTMKQTLKFTTNKDSFGENTSLLSYSDQSYGIMNSFLDKDSLEKYEGSDRRQLIFYPQDYNQKKSYSVYTLYNTLSNKNESIDKIDTLDPSFPYAPQVFNFKGNSNSGDDFMTTYPRMISLRDSKGNLFGDTTLKLNLKFSIKVEGGTDYIPVDVNNGLGVNELNYTFRLVPSAK